VAGFDVVWDFTLSTFFRQKIIISRLFQRPELCVGIAETQGKTSGQPGKKHHTQGGVGPGNFIESDTGDHKNVSIRIRNSIR